MPDVDPVLAPDSGKREASERIGDRHGRLPVFRQQGNRRKLDGPAVVIRHLAASLLRRSEAGIDDTCDKYNKKPLHGCLFFDTMRFSVFPSFPLR